MADLAQQQQRLREQLEKSVEMLKRAALEGSMSTLSDEAKELAQRQRQIADSLARADKAADRAEAQRAAKEMAERTKDLTEEVKKLQERLQQQKAEAGRGACQRGRAPHAGVRRGHGTGGAGAAERATAQRGPA
jgi:seryl-tRNA synthetase